MPTWKEVEEEYGKEVADIMKTSKFLDGITCKLTDSGEMDIPERDIILAYKDINGISIGSWEWD